MRLVVDDLDAPDKIALRRTRDEFLAALGLAIVKRLASTSVANTLDFGDIMAAEFTKDSFESEVLGADKPVLVDFWSEG